MKYRYFRLFPYLKYYPYNKRVFEIGNRGVFEIGNRGVFEIEQYLLSNATGGYFNEYGEYVLNPKIYNKFYIVAIIPYTISR